MATNDIPVLVKHCALAIFHSGDVKGNLLERITGSLDIARHRLTEYGFLKTGSEDGEPSKIKLTGKGMTSEARHRREVGGGKKTKEWDKLYAKIAEAEEEETDEGAMNDQGALVAVKGAKDPAARKKQDQVRRARVAKRRTRRAKVPRAKKAKRG